ncbi:DEAD/DEAH box helicase [Photobacterium damselae]|uniref:DEAD/DEAH box helicase n=1 Tax=Photobacterium damselae TaxID=38293 RepID=UPI002091E24B|nr:DEAD/DEAH box helicase [Photobacterium damselae]USR75787.1 DEAD/DEAH box helicase [Photobacterium damselae]
MSFSTLPLSPSLIHALPNELNTPTDIQSHAIPVLVKHQDVLALAQTGSGKTYAYGLPLLQQIDPSQPKIQALILVPTRELTTQVHQSLNTIAEKMAIRTAILCGGISQEQQEETLNSQPQLVIATTGRLLDALSKGQVSLSHIKSWVLDEADRLLDMGFWPDIQKIIQQLPAKRQTALFSATLPEQLESLTQEVLFKPVRIEAQKTNSVVDTISEQLYLVNKGSKPQALIALLKQYPTQQTLVFIGARDNADALCKRLMKAGIQVAALHGHKEQTEREQILADFKAKKLNVVIATDVLARGIHIEQLPLVINFDLPSNAATYVHRVGRTGRAGNNGLALSLVCHGETEFLTAIRQLTQRPLELHNLDGFPVTDKPTTGESKRKPRDKQANRRTAQKRSVKLFKQKPRKA